MRFVPIVTASLVVCAEMAQADPLAGGRGDIEVPKMSIAPTPLQITAIFEDDGTFTKPIDKTDRHYTAGESLTLALQAPFARDLACYVPSFWNQFDPADTPHTTFALGITAAQLMFTPENLSTAAPIPSDQPYSAMLYGGGFLQRAYTPDTGHATFEHMELDIGVIGPAAQGRQTQQFVHTRFGAIPPEGWANQIHDEVGFNAKYQRKWRYDLWQPADAWGLQVIPQAGLTLGTFDRNAAASATARFGYNLPDDFGPARIGDLPAATGRVFHDLGGYLFLRAGGRLVEHSTALQGNNFRDYPLGVDPVPAVGELNAGFAIQLFKHLDCGWNWTVQSKEFHGQSGYDSYGTVSLSAVFQF